MLKRKPPNEEIPCKIRLLDESEPLNIPVKRNSLGEELFTKVCKELNLHESGYFGLRYVDSHQQRHWIDPLKAVGKQLKGVSPCILCFRLKYYPAEPDALQDELTRYFLFLQCRRDLLHGRLLSPNIDMERLGALIIQSELGDYDASEHRDNYVSSFKILPRQTDPMERKIQEIHRSLTGKVPADVEVEFLRMVAKYETYGADPYPARDSESNTVNLAATHRGVGVFVQGRRKDLYDWASVVKITFDAKALVIHVLGQQDGTQSLLRHKKKKSAHEFKLVPREATREFWLCALEQQGFFRYPRSTEVPKAKSSRSLFHRASKFRFSGRTEREVVALHVPHEKSPSFMRTSLRQVPSGDPRSGGKSLGLLPKPSVLYNPFKYTRNPVVMRQFEEFRRKEEDKVKLDKQRHMHDTHLSLKSELEIEDGETFMTVERTAEIHHLCSGSPSVNRTMSHSPTLATISSTSSSIVEETEASLDAQIQGLTNELKRSRNNLTPGGSPPLTPSSEHRPTSKETAGFNVTANHVDPNSYGGQPSSAIPRHRAPMRLMRWFSAVGVLLLLLLLVLVFFFESDNEMISSVRTSPAVLTLRDSMYAPVRQTVLSVFEQIQFYLRR